MVSNNRNAKHEILKIFAVAAILVSISCSSNGNSQPVTALIAATTTTAGAAQQ